MLCPQDKWSCNSEEAEWNSEAQSVKFFFAAKLLCNNNILGCPCLFSYKYEIWFFGGVDAVAGQSRGLKSGRSKLLKL